MRDKSANRLDIRGRNRLQSRKAVAEESIVTGQQTIGIVLGVSTDQKIGNDTSPGSTTQFISMVELARGKRRPLIKRYHLYLKAHEEKVEVCNGSKCDRKLRVSNDRNRKLSSPSRPAKRVGRRDVDGGLARNDIEENTGVDAGPYHGGRISFMKSSTEAYPSANICSRIDPLYSRTAASKPASSKT